jgi:uncharacterized membrane protein YuzA (DUF378 family)
MRKIQLDNLLRVLLVLIALLMKLNFNSIGLMLYPNFSHDSPKRHIHINKCVCYVVFLSMQVMFSMDLIAFIYHVIHLMFKYILFSVSGISLLIALNTLFECQEERKENSKEIRL